MVVGAVVVVVVVVVVDTDGALVRFNVLNRLDGAPNRLLEPKPVTIIKFYIKIIFSNSLQSITNLVDDLENHLVPLELEL